MDNSEYNGYKNFDTWLAALNIDNEQPLYEETRRMIKEGDIKNRDDLEEWFKDMFFVEKYNIYNICDSWTERDLENIDFGELFKTWKQELEENEGEY
jgi:predicted N-acyltransferase